MSSLEVRTFEWGSQRIGGKEVRPVGRHLQYLVLNSPHGMTERIKGYFQPLVALGKLLNATVHIPRGAVGPRYWLQRKHTFEVGEDWGRYFDLRANGGNPWHELENFKGCKRLSQPPPSVEESRVADTAKDWARVFDDGSLCVNIDYWIDFSRPAMRDVVSRMQPKISVSPVVRSAARDFLVRHGVQGAYGSCHLRRCDRLGSTIGRTDPKAIHAEIAKNPGLRTWLFFVYAEEGYTEELRKRLKPLGLKLLFEDDVVLNKRFPQDNYFTYVLGKYLSSQAEMVVETDYYRSDSSPYAYSRASVQAGGLYLGRGEDSDGELSQSMSYSREEAYLATEEQYEALCDDRPRGAGLLPPNASKAERRTA